MIGRHVTRHPPRLVRNQFTERILPCCWDDCTHNGDDQIRIVQRSESGPNDTVTYIFCSDIHRSMWQNAHKSYGNVDPSGPRRSPLGIYLPG